MLFTWEAIYSFCYQLQWKWNTIIFNIVVEGLWMEYNDRLQFVKLYFCVKIE